MAEHGPSEPPLVNLLEARESFLPRLREKLPHLAQRLEAQGIDADNTTVRILTAAWRADELVESRPDVDPRWTVYIDLYGCEVLGVKFVSRLLELWPHARAVSDNEDLQELWAVVVERAFTGSSSPDREGEGRA